MPIHLHPEKEGLLVRTDDRPCFTPPTVCGKNVAYVGDTLAHPESCSDPNWVDTGDTAWQLTAATFVGLMSLPGLAVLYAGLVPKKWAVNTMFMAFTGFSAVLVVWVLWGYKMGFGVPDRGWHAEHLQLQVHRELLRQLLQ